MLTTQFTVARLNTKFTYITTLNYASVSCYRYISSNCLKIQNLTPNINSFLCRFSSNPSFESDNHVKRETTSFGAMLKGKNNPHWKKWKYMMALGSTFGFTGGIAVFILGRPEKDEEGNTIEDEFSNLPFFQQFFKRMLYEIEYFKKMITEPSRKKLLPDIMKYPYFQPRYTLVLEVTDLLVHPEWTYQTGWRFKKRPGVDKFLEQISSPNFEVVVYTAEQGSTIYPLLDLLDPSGFILYRLVRDATDFIDGNHVKNLDFLNRDLKKVIVVDWNPNSVKLHRDNTFLIPKWDGNDDDTNLVDLAAFLRTIARSEVEDIREILKLYKQFDDPIVEFRKNQGMLLEQMEETERLRKDKKQNSLWYLSWLTGIFK